MTYTPADSYFGGSLAETDPAVAAALAGEARRQSDGIELIASENLVSQATLDALGSPMVNKTVEGYPGNRYYGGAEFADRVERLAVERAKKLFGAAYANVQPHSGSQANLAVFLAFLKPGATVLSMDLSAGGHLSHGASPNISGKWMNIERYGVDESGYLDYDQMADVARATRPELIIAGGSAYPRAIDFEAFREVADEVGAMFLVDMAHWAGLVAAGVHPDPVPIADVVTTTTYKNLRGVRGGIILSCRDDLDRKLNGAVFPGVQGSVILNAVAAKAVCLGEALRPEFRAYGEAVLANSRALAAALIERDITVLTGGTDTPIVVADLRPQGLTGAAASDALESAGLTPNKNGVPNDPQPPQVTSGLRFGSSAGTARGLDQDIFTQIGHWIADVLEALGAGDPGSVATRVRDEVAELVSHHPIYR
ncbi:MAG: serine hydroxymethyltransferase [Actinomycetia bacterium]|nr:serine hydroxymethyltransferase [Actinomycetes bacterium]MCP4961690.1 serine hydroxymethyltransferase [Actinomycetes bacterium]